MVCERNVCRIERIRVREVGALRHLSGPVPLRLRVDSETEPVIMSEGKDRLTSRVSQG